MAEISQGIVETFEYMSKYK